MILSLLVLSCSAHVEDTNTRGNFSAPDRPADAGFLMVLDAGVSSPAEEPAPDSFETVDVPNIPVPARSPEPPSAMTPGASESSDAAPVIAEPHDAGVSNANANEVDANTPPSDAVDSGPLLPVELLEHEAYLESSGFAPCELLTKAVVDCCAEGSAFVCDRDGCGCESTVTQYPAVASLCTIAPATPLRWRCP